MYYVYVLLSKKDNKLYFGYTEDLSKRIEKHYNGEVSSTKYRLPLELIYYEAYKDRNDALQREKSLKKSGRAPEMLKRRLRYFLNKVQ
ncbi:MAG: hypothetical protein A3A94_02780 [Candidatus Portnoybacteria bacterium RIFCSPLOWO2_01_FULL_43_11]|uniref:GIY-YIG domain-containing protein n=2 Tax=Candidatus Portnoyibacteriota TaxID=1817913 RepID=A0A1G2FT62_9BACT|nr:MAG: hypothetical protein A3D38_02445 [Candidatus Portnoybacteria bacterium RIFCSPHIGHO2_02_FULL_40_23]OGZ38032.1 MAG: hypothetical protein A3A94_02780 [Candidatus Portnoybacteria bacterium RIFCSPLOWO2_01_FULL_43_11]OGZ40997.1 MAG: hypothetical protein A3I20_01140 [Candidatus Portnoybacteria bacterium RIFCSPLOWO2_02_FULL_40_15]